VPRPLYGGVRSSRTKNAYRVDMADFRGFGARTNRRVGMPPVPDELLIQYIADVLERTTSFNTLMRRMNGLSAWYRDCGCPRSPLASAPVRKYLERAKSIVEKASCSEEIILDHGLRVAVCRLDSLYEAAVVPRHVDTLRYLRDRAILLVGRHAVLSPGELISLRVEGIEVAQRSSAALELLVNRSKMIFDKGSFVGWSRPDAERRALLPFCDPAYYCPVHALRRWLRNAGIEKGFVFRAIGMCGRMSAGLTRQNLTIIIKQLLGSAGFTAVKGMTLHNSGILAYSMTGSSPREVQDVAGLRDRKSIEEFFALGRAAREALAADSMSLERSRSAALT
jgi:hypothetical protein